MVVWKFSVFWYYSTTLSGETKEYNMSRIAYVNGSYSPHSKAQLHVEDRSTQFSDGVYEVIAVINGKLIDSELHYQRLLRSLAALKIKLPMTTRALDSILKEVVRLNRLHSGLCYLQISRGSAPRNHAFPLQVKASVVVTARNSEPAGGSAAASGVSIITTHDLRWKRRDIKSVSLLPNVLAKEEAVQNGAFEVWLVEPEGDKTVIEGSSSNAWIVDEDGQLLTHPEGSKILSGVTRNRIISLAEKNDLNILEKPFTVRQAKLAPEAFLTSTSSFVVPVIKIDGCTIGQGTPGPITKGLAKIYNKFVTDYCLPRK